MKNEESCPCTSGRTYGDCCGPILSGAVAAETAEALMRARYTAYATEQIDFLKKSSITALQADFDEEMSLSWSRSAMWHGLEILRVEGGQAKDKTGVVEFRAKYTANDKFCDHHEVSQFVKEKGEWKFQDGTLVSETPVTREEPKVGRNDPCPCGSGKKFKKCCGR